MAETAGRVTVTVTIQFVETRVGIHTLNVHSSDFEFLSLFSFVNGENHCFLIINKLE